MQRDYNNLNALHSAGEAIEASSKTSEIITEVDSLEPNQEVDDISQPSKPPRTGKTLFSTKEFKKIRKLYGCLEGQDREFAALRYGFDDHQTHTYYEISSKMNITMTEVREIRRNLLGLAKEQPQTEPLTGQAFLLSRLLIILPDLNNQAKQIVISYYGVGRSQRQSVQEINEQLFHNTPLGEQRIRGVLQAVFNKIYAFEDRQE